MRLLRKRKRFFFLGKKNFNYKIILTVCQICIYMHHLILVSIFLKLAYLFVVLSRGLLEKEMEVVKKGMQHGDLSLDAYTQVRRMLRSQYRISIFWPDIRSDLIPTGYRYSLL